MGERKQPIELPSGSVRPPRPPPLPLSRPPRKKPKPHIYEMRLVDKPNSRGQTLLQCTIPIADALLFDDIRRHYAGGSAHDINRSATIRIMIREHEMMRNLAKLVSMVKTRDDVDLIPELCCRCKEQITRNGDI